MRLIFFSTVILWVTVTQLTLLICLKCINDRARVHTIIYRRALWRASCARTYASFFRNGPSVYSIVSHIHRLTSVKWYIYIERENMTNRQNSVEFRKYRYFLLVHRIINRFCNTNTTWVFWRILQIQVQVYLYIRSII